MDWMKTTCGLCIRWIEQGDRLHLYNMSHVYKEVLEGTDLSQGLKTIGVDPMGMLKT